MSSMKKVYRKKWSTRQWKEENDACFLSKSEAQENLKSEIVGNNMLPGQIVQQWSQAVPWK